MEKYRYMVSMDARGNSVVLDLLVLAPLQFWCHSDHFVHRCFVCDQNLHFLLFTVEGDLRLNTLTQASGLLNFSIQDCKALPEGRRVNR